MSEQSANHLWNIFNSFDISAFEKLDKELQDDTTRADEKLHFQDSEHCTCGGTLVYDDGMYVCSDCFVICTDKKIPFSHDILGVNSCNTSTHMGHSSNPLLPKASLGTTISKRATYGSYSMIYKCQSWQSMPYDERSKWTVFSELERNGLRAGISKRIIDDSKQLYSSVCHCMTRGANRRGLKAACLMFACKKNKVARSGAEISAIMGITKQELSRGSKIFLEIMNKSRSKNMPTIECSDASDYIKRYCSKAQVPTHIVSLCQDVIRIAKEKGLTHQYTPPSIASASILLVCNVLKIPINKKDLALSCNLSDVTITKCHRGLFKYRSYLFTPETQRKYCINFW